ncbi:MAG TPA: addiction module protein [Terriglobia bacterium]|jgi:hypothetical protein
MARSKFRGREKAGRRFNRQSDAAKEAETDSDARAEEELLLPQESETHQPLRLIEFSRNFEQRLNVVPRIDRGASSGDVVVQPEKTTGRPPLHFTLNQDTPASRPPGTSRYTAIMSIKLPLNEMTLQEKLAAMEALWEDLSRSPGAIKSPEWHKEILDERRKRVDDGAAQFEDWDQVKVRMREKLR